MSTNDPSLIEREKVFLRKAGLAPLRRIHELSTPHGRDRWPQPLPDLDLARQELVFERCTEPGYRKPEGKLRNFWRSTESSYFRRKNDSRVRVFKKHIIAKAFDRVVNRSQPPRSSIARAILSHAPDATLEDLWVHFNDPKLEKRRFKSYWSARTHASLPITWLDTVIAQKNLAYIRLMCQAGLSQDALDRAFGIALLKPSMDAMRILLGYGARASAYTNIIRNRIRGNDVALVELLLEAPTSMTSQAWRESLEQPKADLPLRILSLCLTYHPTPACGPLLMETVSRGDLASTAMILAHATPGAPLPSDECDSICRLAREIEDDEKRQTMFGLLAEGHLLADTHILREELFKAVQLRHLPLIRVLIAAGVCVDSDSHNALTWTVSRMDLEVLRLFKVVNFSRSASEALDSAPKLAKEIDLLQLVEILSPADLYGIPLHVRLIRAVEQRQYELITRLISLNASVEFNGALAIQQAIENTDVKALDLLLQAECSDIILANAITPALNVDPMPERFQVFKKLFQKGLRREDTGLALQTLVVDSAGADMELVQLFLDYEAAIDGVGEANHNCVLVAARQGNVPLLRMLCEPLPSVETISAAVAVALDSRDAVDYQEMLAAVKLLLDYGATSPGVHEALVRAASNDDRLDIVRLLVERGADANFDNGAPYSIALKSRSVTLLELLCQTCPPSQATLARCLPIAIDSDYHCPQALEVFLDDSHAPAAIINSAWSSLEIPHGETLSPIMLCLLRHGLDVNLVGGSVPRAAILAGDVSLLNHVLSMSPSVVTLAKAFEAACVVPDRTTRIASMEALLTQADSEEIGQSKCLAEETLLACIGDDSGLRLLLEHKIFIDTNEGNALQVAATFGNLGILDKLMSLKPSIRSINQACLATIPSALGSHQRREVFDYCLNAKPDLPASDLLTLSVVCYPEHTELPSLLLTRDADVSSDAIEAIVKTSSQALFDVLVRGFTNDETIADIFKRAGEVELDDNRRYWIYEHVLARGVPCHEMAEALHVAVETVESGDLALLKLLLRNGAAVKDRFTETFLHALRKNSLEVIILLSQYIMDNETAKIAFQHTRGAALDGSSTRFEIYRCLLQWNIDRTSVSGALVDNLEDPSPSIAITKLLLAKGADPNGDRGQCFSLTCAIDTEEQFRLLSRYAQSGVVMHALLSRFNEEEIVKHWFAKYCEEQHSTVTIESNDVLFHCLEAFPQGTEVLEMLLAHGVSASATMSYSICQGWPEEECTALIWALLAPFPIANETLMVLIREGRNAVQPDYCTPVSGVSAAFACLLNKERTPILEALLEMDNELEWSSIPGPSLDCLAVRPSLPTPESAIFQPGQEPTLSTASLFLGNLDAYRLLDHEEGDLHAAAHMAVPGIVELLLETQDPNAQIDAFNQMIPLAIACEAEASPICKIANEESDFKTRQQRTIELLGPKTDVNWRYREMTVLHVALWNGVEITQTVMTALNIAADEDRCEKYTYHDRDGKALLPHQWVEQYHNGDWVEKMALVYCLSKVSWK